MNAQHQVKLLRIVAPHFVAGMVFQKNVYGTWVVTQTAPIIAWMRKMTPCRIKTEIQTRGWDYQWIESCKPT